LADQPGRKRTVGPRGLKDGSVVGLGPWRPGKKKTSLEAQQAPRPFRRVQPGREEATHGRGGLAEAPERGGRKVKVWDLAAGKVTTNYPWNTGPVFAVAVSPDGKTFAAGGADGIQLWDAGTPENPGRCPGFAAGHQFDRRFAADSQNGGGGGALHRVVHLWDPNHREGGWVSSR